MRTVADWAADTDVFMPLTLVSITAYPSLPAPSLHNTDNPVSSTIQVNSLLHPKSQNPE
jgi:hypothetical protein